LLSWSTLYCPPSKVSGWILRDLDPVREWSFSLAALLLRRAHLNDQLIDVMFDTLVRAAVVLIAV
jgi:hypothetical protein